MYTITLSLLNYFNIHFIFHLIFIGLNLYVTCNLRGNQFCNWELNHKHPLYQYTSNGPTTGVWFILLHLVVYYVRSLSSYRNTVAWDHQKNNNIIRERIIQCWERVNCLNEIELSRTITATDVTVDYFFFIDECIISLQNMWLNNENDLKKIISNDRYLFLTVCIILQARYNYCLLQRYSIQIIIFQSEFGKPMDNIYGTTCHKKIRAIWVFFYFLVISQKYLVQKCPESSMICL